MNSVKLHIPNNWMVIEEEQIRARASKIQLADVQLFDPFNGVRGQGIASYGKLYRYLSKQDPAKVRILGSGCVDYLLSVEDQIPESWRRFRIQFWGTIFRTRDPEQAHLDGRPKMLQMVWEPLLTRWTVRVDDMGKLNSGKPRLDELSVTLSDDSPDKYRIPFVKVA